MRIHGRHGSIEIGSPGVIVGSVTKWTLNQARDYVDVTCFGDNNKVYVPGLRDISGTLNFVYDLNPGSPSSGQSEGLFDAAESETPVTIKLVPNTLDTSHYWKGPGYLDLATIDVDVKGAVTGTSNFKASGAWSRH
jgi:hypothetical protein